MRGLGLLFGLEYLDADAGIYVGVLAVACDGVEVRVAGVGEDGCDGVVDGLGHTSFPCNGEVGDLAVDAHVVCGYDASLLEVHCIACMGCVSCEDGVGSVACLRAASAANSGRCPEDVGVDVPRVVNAVCGRAAVCLVLAAFEVDEVGLGQIEEAVHEVADDVCAETYASFEST